MDDGLYRGGGVNGMSAIGNGNSDLQQPSEASMSSVPDWQAAVAAIAAVTQQQRTMLAAAQMKR